MQALIEQVFGGSFAMLVAARIFGKDRRTGEAEQLSLGEKAGDVFMDLSELGTVAITRLLRSAT